MTSSNENRAAGNAVDTANPAAVLRAWIRPAIEALPRLSELTLQSNGDIPGGGGTGGGGSTVVP